MSDEVAVCVGKSFFGISKLPLWHIAMFAIFRTMEGGSTADFQRWDYVDGKD
jgi:hypothetical protein